MIKKLNRVLFVIIVVSLFVSKGYADENTFGELLFPEAAEASWVIYAQPDFNISKSNNFAEKQSPPLSNACWDEKCAKMPSTPSIEQVSGLFRKGSYVQCCCCSFHSEELAPAQRLWPDAWKSSFGVNPWIAVIESENNPSVTLLNNGCYSCFYDQNSFDLKKLNSSQLLAEDRPVTELNLNIKPKQGRMPQQKSRSSIACSQTICEENRQWEDCLVHWNASQATHHPLYFEEVNLERHGYSRGYLQPFVSGFQFFSTAPLLPGLMTIDRPLAVQYELGESRTGSCASYQKRKTPWTAKAVFVEIGVVTGMSFLIP